VAVVGEAAKERCVLRSGAQAGDALFVTGKLGGSLAGRHLEFEPRVAEGQWLAANFPVHAMIDISDGLAGDLGRMMTASQVGAELLASAIPISREARLAARSTPSGKTPLESALTDGEDFELLFTVPKSEAVGCWTLGSPVSRDSANLHREDYVNTRLVLRTKDGARPLVQDGYVHLA